MLFVGRVQTMLLARGIGASCQIIMAMAPQLWPVTWVMVPVLLFRIGTLHGRQEADRLLVSYFGRQLACCPSAYSQSMLVRPVVRPQLCSLCRLHGLNRASEEEHRHGHGAALRARLLERCARHGHGHLCGRPSFFKGRVRVKTSTRHHSSVVSRVSGKPTAIKWSMQALRMCGPSTGAAAPC